MKKLEGSGPYWAMNGLLEACNVPVICHIVDLILKGVVNKTIKEFAFDLNEVIYSQF
jgi:hypothetical protein